MTLPFNPVGRTMETVVCQLPQTECQMILPGGGELAINLTFGYPTPMALATQIMASINTATAPMNAMFRVLEALNATLKCATGVKDGVIHGNPFEVLVSLGECLPNLIEKLQQLIPLMPPVSAIAMLRGMVCALLQVVTAVESILDAIRRSVIRLEPMQNAIPKLHDAILEDTYIDALGRICKVYRHTGSLLGLIAVIWETVTLCGELTGAKIPAIDWGFMMGPTVDLSVPGINAAYNQVAAIQEILEAIYRSLP